MHTHYYGFAEKMTTSKVGIIVKVNLQYLGYFMGQPQENNQETYSVVGSCATPDHARKRESNFVLVAKQPKHSINEGGCIHRYSQTKLNDNVPSPHCNAYISLA